MSQVHGAVTPLPEVSARVWGGEVVLQYLAINECLLKSVESDDLHFCYLLDDLASEKRTSHFKLGELTGLSKFGGACKRNNH